MKVQNTKGETIPLEKVAELPVPQAEGDGDTADDILASSPDVPVCAKCKKQASEVNADGFCCVCQPPLPKVMELSAPMSAIPSRPSLLVEMDVNSNLKPRVLAHVGRMRAWDLRKLDIETRAEFAGALDALACSFGRLEDALMKLVQLGFVAKTTPVTRIAAKLAVGAKVSLREDQRAMFATVYTAEQLDSLSVAKVTDTHVQLVAGDGTNVGLAKIIHVEPRL